jgi:hypothetical protein
LFFRRIVQAFPGIGILAAGKTLEPTLADRFHGDDNKPAVLDGEFDFVLEFTLREQRGWIDDTARVANLA